MKMMSQESEITRLLDRLTSVGQDAPTIEEKLQIAQQARARSADFARDLDQYLIEQIERFRCGLQEARSIQGKLEELLKEMTEPPLHLAVFSGLTQRERGHAAVVIYGNSRRVVSVADGIDPLSLEVGEEVLLCNGLNALVGKSQRPFLKSGEMATFERYMPDQRLVLRYRGEEIIVDAADSLGTVRLRNGDPVRWNRNSFMAFEKIDRSKGDQLFLEENPRDDFDSIGGLDSQIDALQRAIRLHLHHPDLVRKYGVRRKGSVLLVGPPGTGKTMIARALANWLGKISRSRRSRFMSIKPAGLHSMWYGETEANYREAFRVAREAAGDEPEIPVVMFFDEVDSLGSSRGQSHLRIDDRVLTAFMTELDGLDSRGNILVIAATNRRDALDPALLRPGRLGDLVLEVPRPGMRAARDIFARYLGSNVPYIANGQGSAAARDELIDLAVSTIYAPNSESDLASITFRDGRRRLVKAPDLMSGASIAKIVQAAKENACMAEIEGHQPGIAFQHMRTAIADELQNLAAGLTPGNSRSHLDDLPQDVDVVRVDVIRRKVSRGHKYLRSAT